MVSFEVLAAIIRLTFAGVLLDLSAGAVKRAAELEGEVNELRREVATWKQAHATLRETAEWAVTMNDAAPLRRQLYAVTHPPVSTDVYRPYVRYVHA